MAVVGMFTYVTMETAPPAKTDQTAEKADLVKLKLLSENNLSNQSHIS